MSCPHCSSRVMVTGYRLKSVKRTYDGYWFGKPKDIEWQDSKCPGCKKKFHVETQRRS